jgi:Putative amidoligase enzyme
MLLNEIFSYSPIPILKTPVISGTKYNIVDDTAIIGIEVEVEGILDREPYLPLWNCIEDGSLRNNGAEYVSVPTKSVDIESSLRFLKGKLPPSREFSPRTSVHVHLNVQDMQIDQLKTMVLLYIVFEKALFTFVGEKRDRNIHCVPLRETRFLDRMNSIFTKFGLRENTWLKYSALNLCPMGVPSRGTVEFRHMHGTDDVDKLMIWINLILSLRSYAMKNSYDDVYKEVFELNSNSLYRHFLEKVFGEYSRYLVDSPMYGNLEKGMEVGISMVKVFFSVNKYKKALLKAYNPSLSELCPLVNSPPHAPVEF